MLATKAGLDPLGRARRRQRQQRGQQRRRGQVPAPGVDPRLQSRLPPRSDDQGRPSVPRGGPPAGGADGGGRSGRRAVDARARGTTRAGGRWHRDRHTVRGMGGSVGDDPRPGRRRGRRRPRDRQPRTERHVQFRPCPTPGSATRCRPWWARSMERPGRRRPSPCRTSGGGRSRCTTREMPPPLFWDEEYARTTRHGGVVAPGEFNPFAWFTADGPVISPTFTGPIREQRYPRVPSALPHPRRRTS